MAHHGSFSSSHSSHGSASPSVSTSSAVSGGNSVHTGSFSVFQEGPGRPLVFAPPLGTPELQALVELFIALDIPVSMKMEMIQRDFEAHTARTNERYKTYFVPAAAAAAAAATPATSITSPAIFTTSPNPIFSSVFESSFNQSTPMSGTSGSGSGGAGFDASPLLRPSPTDSDLTIASDSLFPMPAPIFSTHFATSFNGDRPSEITQNNGGGFFPFANERMASGSSTVAGSLAPSTFATWPTMVSSTVIPTEPISSHSRSVRQSQQQRPSQAQQRRRLSGSSSMQILTRTGEDVTHVSSRATRTHEERENTRLVRQRGACPDCRRKKTRCNPSHVGSTLERVTRAAPYTAHAQSGRAKEEAAAAKAAKASQEKIEGKKPATTFEPIIRAPQASTTTRFAGLVAGGSGGTPELSQNYVDGSDLLQDSFDWEQVSDHGRLFTTEDLELDIATTLASVAPLAAAHAEAPALESATDAGLARVDEYGVPPTRPRHPQRPPVNSQQHTRHSVVRHAQQPLGGLSTDASVAASQLYCSSPSTSLDPSHFSRHSQNSSPALTATQSHVQPSLGETGSSSLLPASVPSSLLVSSFVTPGNNNATLLFASRQDMAVTDAAEARLNEGGLDRNGTGISPFVNAGIAVPSNLETDPQNAEAHGENDHLYDYGPGHSREETEQDQHSGSRHEHLRRRLLQQGPVRGVGESHLSRGSSSHAFRLGENSTGLETMAPSQTGSDNTGGSQASTAETRVDGQGLTSRHSGSLPTIADSAGSHSDATTVGDRSITSGGISSLLLVRAEAETSPYRRSVSDTNGHVFWEGGAPTSDDESGLLQFLAVLAVYARLATLASSVISMLTTWSAASSLAGSESVSVVNDQLEKLDLGSTMVACQ